MSGGSKPTANTLYKWTMEEWQKYIRDMEERYGKDSNEAAWARVQYHHYGRNAWERSQAEKAKKWNGIR